MRLPTSLDLWHMPQKALSQKNKGSRGSFLSPLSKILPSFLLSLKSCGSAVPGPHGPYTSQYIKHGSISVTKTSFNVPKLPHFFFFFLHTNIFNPGLSWMYIHPLEGLVPALREVSAQSLWPRRSWLSNLQDSRWGLGQAVLRRGPGIWEALNCHANELFCITFLL